MHIFYTCNAFLKLWVFSICFISFAVHICSLRSEIGIMRCKAYQICLNKLSAQALPAAAPCTTAGKQLYLFQCGASSHQSGLTILF